jgi:hypothetical protein
MNCTREIIGFNDKIMGACLNCNQSVPYSYFSNDRKIGLCLDGYRPFRIPMLFANSSSFSSQCWPTHGQAKPQQFF